MCDKMTKKKLNTFKTSNATIENNAAYGGKLVEIKEERGLLQKTHRNLKKSTTA